jgi:trk system potassium uptake protein
MSSTARPRAGLFRHPAQYVVAAFTLASTLGALALSLPIAAGGGERAPFVVALFTATSAVCVTGLSVVDTATYWSGFGQVVILVLMQVGGFGIMAISSVIAVVFVRRLGLRRKLIAAAESGTMDLGDVRRLLLGVVRFGLAVEAVAAVALAVRFWASHDEPVGRALWLGVFHAVSAFNNAGFALFSDNLVGFARDPVVLVVVATTVVVGGVGFPAWLEIVRQPRRPARWNLHTKLTVTTTAVLLVVGAGLYAWFEWTNVGTLGTLSAPDSMLNAAFLSAMPRTAGFNALDTAALREPSRLLTEVLMVIGGGSASTAGGIKVTTFALLAGVIWSEARGDADVVMFRRRVPEPAQRQALTVALLAVGVVVVSLMLLLAVSDLPRADLLFETVSALGTVGLSTGATAQLDTVARLLVSALMLLGRVGPITLFAALVLRERRPRYRHAEGRPIIG